MSAAQRNAELEVSEQLMNELVAAIAWHDGDTLATIRTLLQDCKHLRGQLALVEATMSFGFARGWRPSPEWTEDAI